MEQIEYDLGIRAVFGLNERISHIHHHRIDGFTLPGLELIEKPLQGFGFAMLSDKQPRR